MYVLRYWCVLIYNKLISEVAANLTITFLQLTRRTVTIENGNMDYKHIFQALSLLLSNPNAKDKLPQAF